MAAAVGPGSCGFEGPKAMDPWALRGALEGPGSRGFEGREAMQPGIQKGALSLRKR